MFVSMIKTSIQNSYSLYKLEKENKHEIFQEINYIFFQYNFYELNN